MHHIHHPLLTTSSLCSGANSLCQHNSPRDWGCQSNQHTHSILFPLLTNTAKITSFAQQHKCNMLHCAGVSLPRQQPCALHSAFSSDNFISPWCSEVSLPRRWSLKRLQPMCPPHPIFFADEHSQHHSRFLQQHKCNMLHCKQEWIPEFTNKSRRKMLGIKCNGFRCMKLRTHAPTFAAKESGCGKCVVAQFDAHQEASIKMSSLFITLQKSSLFATLQ